MLHLRIKVRHKTIFSCNSRRHKNTADGIIGLRPICRRLEAKPWWPSLRGRRAPARETDKDEILLAKSNLWPGELGASPRGPQALWAGSKGRSPWPPEANGSRAEPWPPEAQITRFKSCTMKFEAQRIIFAKNWGPKNEARNSSKDYERSGLTFLEQILGDFKASFSV